MCDDLDISVSASRLTHPDYLELHQIPIEHRRKWLVKSDKQRPDLIMDINKMISGDAIQNNDKLDDFKYVTGLLDSYHGVKFSDTNPEIYNIIKELSVE